VCLQSTSLLSDEEERKYIIYFLNEFLKLLLMEFEYFTYVTNPQCYETEIFFLSMLQKRQEHMFFHIISFL
jgi:hypothetical protein